MRASLVLVVLAGCATTPPGSAPSSPAESDGRALSALLAEARPVAAESALSAAPRAPLFGAAKGDIRDVYRKVAPATVLIRAGGGFGTGVVINAKGFILTNHHVVAHAETVDFKRRVTVERGRLGAGGVMELDPQPLVAWVLKSDPLIDLAIVKLDAPPKDLHALRVSSKDPVPGEPVSALGNGGIGLLWAIKDGEISSIGKLATHLAQLVAAQCDVADTSAACKSAGASAELQKQLIEREVPGLVIQTSCTISPGDSGGPLVNRAGELVGVNAFLRADPRAPVTSNFHVHVAEVRKFLKDVPVDAVAIVPDPHELVHGGMWLDANGDGRRDLYLAGQAGSADVMVESQGVGGGLDPDLAVARLSGRRIAWYDVDDDGRFDRVVITEKEDSPGRAWALEAGLKLGRFLGAAKLVDMSVFKDVRHEALAALEPTVISLVGAGEPPDPGALPSATELVLTPPTLSDADRDGRPDLAVAFTAAGVRVLVDPAQRVLPGLKPAEVAAGIQKGTLHTDVEFVSTRGRTWGFVGSTDHRLALSSASGEGIVEDAFFLAPEGRGLTRPELYGAALSRVVRMHFTGVERARLEAGYEVMDARKSGPRPSGLYPDAIKDVGTDVLAEESGVDGFKWAAVSIVGERGGGSSLVFELDAKALEGVTPEAREEAVRKGGSGTDFTWVGWGAWAWASYDLDADGAFDVVLISHGGKLEGRRVAKDGSVAVDPKLAGGALVRPSLFTDARRAALEKLAPVFFPPSDVERATP
ncbi:MAG: S1C family serine protease [Myxococcota bacterium]